jgi:hypothetical protein
MRKTILLTLGMLLIGGPMGQVATASEQVRKADDTAATTQDAHHREAYDQYRGAYDQSIGSPAPLTAEEERNKEDFGVSGRDPSRVGGEDPSLNPE